MARTDPCAPHGRVVPGRSARRRARGLRRPAAVPRAGPRCRYRARSCRSCTHEWSRRTRRCSRRVPASSPRLPAWTPCSLPFVGRYREETQIFERLRDVAAGSTHMVLVEGVAGIGKSRLALEAARRAGGDAIVLAIDGGDALRPGLQVVAAALADASSHLSDAELRLCLGRWPGDLAGGRARRCGAASPIFRPRSKPTTRRAARAYGRRSCRGSARLSQRAPVLLLVDDIHRAGAALLLLVGAALVDEEPKRVLVVATARSGDAERSSRLDRLLWSLERARSRRPDRARRPRARVGRAPARRARAIPTRRAWLRSSRRSPTAIRTCWARCCASRTSRRRRPTADDVASRIRQFVLRRVAALGGPRRERARHRGGHRRRVRRGACSPRWRTAPSSRPRRSSIRRSARDLLHVTGPGTFDFVHDLGPAAIAESRDDGTRAEEHAEIAAVLERRGAAPARIASQWAQRVAGPSRTARRCSWADRAGDAALRDLDPHAAVDWFAFAVARADDERTRAHLLIRFAGAQCQAGGRPRVPTPCGRRSRSRAGSTIPTSSSKRRRSPTPIWNSMPTLTSSERVRSSRTDRGTARDRATRAHSCWHASRPELVLTPEWAAGANAGRNCAGRSARAAGCFGVGRGPAPAHFPRPSPRTIWRSGGERGEVDRTRGPPSRIRSRASTRSTPPPRPRSRRSISARPRLYPRRGVRARPGVRAPGASLTTSSASAPGGADLAGDLEEAERLVFGRDRIRYSPRRRERRGRPVARSSDRCAGSRTVWGSCFRSCGPSPKPPTPASAILLARALADFDDAEARSDQRC